MRIRTYHATSTMQIDGKCDERVASHLDILEHTVRQGRSNRFHFEFDLLALAADKENYRENLRRLAYANTVHQQVGNEYFPALDTDSCTREPDWVVVFVDHPKPQHAMDMHTVIANLEKQAEQSLSTSSDKDPVNENSSTSTSTNRKIHNSSKAHHHYDMARFIPPLLEGRINHNDLPTLRHVAMHRHLCERVSMHVALNYENARTLFHVDSNTLLRHGHYECSMCKASVYNAHNIVANEGCLCRTRSPLFSDASSARRCCAMVVNGFMHCGVCLAKINYRQNFLQSMERLMQYDAHLLDI